MFYYLKTLNDFVSIICSEIDEGYRDLTVEFENSRTKLLHENRLPEKLDHDLNDIKDRICASVVLNQNDLVLNFILLNDFDVGGEPQNEIFRRGMVKKFGAEYFAQLSEYVLEKNCQQVEMLTNKTLNNLRALRQFVEVEKDPEL